MLRRVRAVDPESGVTAARLSALSVVVHAGPLPVGELADREQVSAPTTSRMLSAMEEQQLVTRHASPDDGRVVLIEATDRGRRILQRARGRRVRELARALKGLAEADRTTIRRAVDVLERRVGPGHPHPEADG